MCEQTDRSCCRACRDNVCLVRSSPISPQRRRVLRFRNDSLQSLKRSRGHFSVTDSGHMQLKSGHQRRWPPPWTPFYDTRKNKKTKKKMKWWQRGNIISLQVNKNRTKCFTSAPAFWILAWQYAGSASMLHSSLLQKEDGDLNTGLYCQCQMSPHVVETIQGGVPHLTNHTPCLFSVSSTVERCSTPLRPTAMTPNIPSHGSNDFTLRPIIDKYC